MTTVLQPVKLRGVSNPRQKGGTMNVIQTELTEALADLAAKCPGADVHIQVHNAPVETFAADDVGSVRVLDVAGRLCLSGRAEFRGLSTAGGLEYRIEFYSVPLPQSSSPDAEVIAL